MIKFRNGIGVYYTTLHRNDVSTTAVLDTTIPYTVIPLNVLKNMLDIPESLLESAPTVSDNISKMYRPDMNLHKICIDNLNFPRTQAFPLFMLVNINKDEMNYISLGLDFIKFCGITKLPESDLFLHSFDYFSYVDYHTSDLSPYVWVKDGVTTSQYVVSSDVTMSTISTVDDGGIIAGAESDLHKITNLCK